jgi:hypothetical protein
VYYQNDWRYDDLVARAGAPQKSYQTLAGYDTTLPRFTVKVYALDADGHVNQFSLEGGSWRHVDVTARVGAPRAELAELVAFDVSYFDQDQRVYYLDGAQHLHELTYREEPEPEPEPTEPAPEPEPTTRPVTLQRQSIPGPGPIPYRGEFPDFGVVPPGRLTQIRVPQVGPSDLEVRFVKHGRSTAECNNPAAVVVVREGQSTTPEMVNAIFGVSEPRFSTTSPLVFTACVGTTGPLPNFVNTQITVRFD